jgi:hypothetical protein
MAATVTVGWVAAAPTTPNLTFNPPPGTRLDDTDAFVTVTFDIGNYRWDTMPWDWQNPQVFFNGQDISQQVKSLVAGATASVLTKDKIVLSEQSMSTDRMVLALSGLRLDPGFNRLVVKLPPKSDGEEIDPLEFDVSYPVIPGQNQVDTK